MQGRHSDADPNAPPYVKRRRAWLASLSHNQLERYFHRVWDGMTEGDGYQPYGYDELYLKVSYPGWYELFKDAWYEGRRRRLNRALGRVVKWLNDRSLQGDRDQG